MKNKIVKIMLTIVLFGLSTKVQALSAFPSTFTTGSEGTSVTLNNNHSLEIDTSQTVGSTHNYPYFHVKNSSVGNIICVSGLGVKEPVPGLTYEKGSWSDANQSKGVAYIINTIIGTGGNAAVSAEKYYWTEVLINAYLGTYAPGEGKYMYINVINTSKTIAGTGKTYKEILTEAISYANADYSVNLSADKTSLVFELNEDGYYYSSPVTITSTTSYTLSNLSNSKFSYDKNGNSYIFKIKSSDIELGGNESFSVTISNLGKDYYTAQRYYNSTSYQDVTLSQTVKNTTSPQSITINGSVTKPTTKTKVSKLDATGKKELPGATLEIQDEKGNIVKYCTDKDGNKNTECKWVSTDKPYEIEGLPTGKYYLIETIAPKGYELNKEKVLFEVKDDGSVTEVVMENQLEVEVPDTLSSRSALLLAIAMFDIALGIGIVTYVKKNKIRE